MSDSHDYAAAHSTPWRTRPYHRQWLMDEANKLFDFFQYSSVNPKGGFYELDAKGQPLPNSLRLIHSTTRMVHCFSVASMLGRPGADVIVDHGMEFIWNGLRDKDHGGYMWSLDDNGPKDDSKQAYGNAFVLLAASSAKLAGHPLADQVLNDVAEVIETRFWDEEHGVVTEEFKRDWSPISNYRGQNSNMHLTEALMAAYEATGNKIFLERAERIAAMIIGHHAAGLDYRVAEHFDENWKLDKDYSGGDMFRPAGTTPGHWLEWARLLLQLFVLGHKRLGWLPDAARALFHQSIDLGWDKEHGGFFYTLEWDNAPRNKQKLWWPVSEAIGAAAWLTQYDRNPYYEAWYRRLWDFATINLFDRENGAWHPELSVDLKVDDTLFTGKPDIYHALQACLIPLFPANGSITHGIKTVDSAR